MGFHGGELDVQKHAGVRALADQVGEGIADYVSDGTANFLAHRRMVMLGTVDPHRRAWASLITGEPGFISVVDPRIVRVGALPPTGDPLLDNLAKESHTAFLAIDFLSARRVRINGRGVIKDGAFDIRTAHVYGNCRRYIQERMIFAGPSETRSTQEVTMVRSSALSAAQRRQISEAETFFIATDHPENGADVSHKGGNPGFVRIIDARHLAFPDYNGNSMFNTLGNITVNP